MSFECLSIDCFTQSIFGGSSEYPNIFGLGGRVRIFGFPNRPTQEKNGSFRSQNGQNVLPSSSDRRLTFEYKKRPYVNLKKRPMARHIWYLWCASWAVNRLCYYYAMVRISRIKGLANSELLMHTKVINRHFTLNIFTNFIRWICGAHVLGL